MTFYEARVALQMEAEERIGSPSRKAVEVARAREDHAAESVKHALGGSR